MSLQYLDFSFVSEVGVARGKKWRGPLSTSTSDNGWAPMGRCQVNGGYSKSPNTIQKSV